MTRVFFVAIIVMVIDTIVSAAFNMPRLNLTAILITAFGVVIINKLDKMK